MWWGRMGPVCLQVPQRPSGGRGGCSPRQEESPQHTHRLQGFQQPKGSAWADALPPHEVTNPRRRLFCSTGAPKLPTAGQAPLARCHPCSAPAMFSSGEALCAILSSPRAGGPNKGRQVACFVLPAARAGQDRVSPSGMSGPAGHSSQDRPLGHSALPSRGSSSEGPPCLRVFISASAEARSLA